MHAVSASSKRCKGECFGIVTQRTDAPIGDSHEGNLMLPKALHGLQQRSIAAKNEDEIGLLWAAAHKPSPCPRRRKGVDRCDGRIRESVAGCVSRIDGAFVASVYNDGDVGNLESCHGILPFVS